MADDKNSRDTRHWSGPGQHPSERPFTSIQTKPEQNAVSELAAQEVRRQRARPLNDVRTLVDLDENLERRLKSFAHELRDDFRLRDQKHGARMDELTREVRELTDRVLTVESSAQGAVRDSSSALETAREHAQLLIELRKTQQAAMAQREAAASMPTTTEIVAAQTSASEEFAGLIRDVRASVKKWGFLAAITFGVISAGASFLGSRGTAKEAAESAVQSAPKVQEKIFYVQPPPQSP